MLFVNGMWVKFADPIGIYHDAFHSQDGKVVGILDLGDEDGPPHVSIVAPDGSNVERGGFKATVKPINLEPIDSLADIPEQRTCHMRPEDKAAWEGELKRRKSTYWT